MTGSSFIDGLAGVADAFDAVLVDQYGVLHDGRTAYPGAADALARLTALGKPVIVLTNSGKRAAPNMERLGRLGIPRASYATLASSGEVTWQGLRTGAFGPPFEAGGRVCVIGRSGEDYGLDDLGLTPVAEPAAADFLVIAGSDCPATSLDRYNDRLAPAAARHVPALCANPDLQMLTPGGLQPAPGAIARLYEDLGGRVVFVGKPYPAIYARALTAAGSWVKRVLCIGDSLEHDVAGGAEAGFSTALVRTGVLEGTDDAALADLIGKARHRPDYVLPSLRW